MNQGERLEALCYRMNNSILSEQTLKWVKDKGLISSETYDCLTDQGLEHLSQIQLQAFPPLLSKQNVYIKARTGSGKTLAFVVPAIERLKRMKFHDNLGTGTLIISPTRELALQTARVLLPLCEAHGLSCSTLIGGTKNSKNIAKSAVILGTPGRLLEAIKQNNNNGNNSIVASKLRIIILDEADRLLDGASHTLDIQEIVKHISLEKVQKVLVSATKNNICMKYAREIFQSSFIDVSCEKEEMSTSHHIPQNYLFVNSQDRLSMLVTVLKTLRKKKVIVFFNSCHSVKFHHLLLSHLKLPVVQCVGQDKQSRRSNKYELFLSMKKGILLTTGLAERGWDIPDVSWIIQYDPPHRPEDYVHRVGRTGRGEHKTGQALLFLCPHEEKFIKYLLNMNINIEQIEFDGELEEIKTNIKSFVENDFTAKEAGKIAYKKFIRAYQCHKLRKIFDIKKLDLSEVCQSFGFTEPPVQMGHLS